MSGEPGDQAGSRARCRAARRAERRAGRRGGARHQIDTSIPSPCISVCQIDEFTSACIGCRRTIDEIRDWIIMSAEEKQSVLANIARRAAATASGR